METQKQTAPETPEEILRSEGYIVADPLAEYMKKNWRQMVITIVAVLAAWFGYQMIQDTRDASLKASADTFAKVREKYEIVSGIATRLQEAKSRPAVKEDEIKKRDEEVARIEKELLVSREGLLQTIEALGDGRAPYPELAVLYRQLVELSGAQSSSGAMAMPNWASIDANSPDRFFGEIRAISVLRSQLDDEGTRRSAQEGLLALAEKGVFMNTAAALTLARVASTSDELSQAREVLQAIRVQEPSQIDLVSGEIERLESEVRSRVQ